MYLYFTERLRRSIEAGIDVFMPVECAKAPGQIDPFVDNDFVRDIDPRLQLIDAYQENAKLNRIELIERSVDQGVDRFLEFVLRLANCFQLFIEIRLVNALVRNLIAKLR